MAYVSGYQGQANFTQALAIPAAGTTTPAIDLAGFCLVGIKVPATFTSTAITFLMCDTLAGTYIPLKVTTSGTALSQTVTTSSYYAIDPIHTQGVRFLKIVAGSTESAERVLTLSLKGF